MWKNDLIDRFQKAISQTRDLYALHEALIQQAQSLNIDDLLRFQIVHSISALDRLIHDLVREGMVEILKGNKSSTRAYLSFPITLKLYADFSTHTAPLEILFSRSVLQFFQNSSFQTPDKISKALSYIWEEKHKWQKIADALSMDKKGLEVQLKLYVDMRNSIVHEAHRHPLTFELLPIEKKDAQNCVSFIEQVGLAIVACV